MVIFIAGASLGNKIAAIFHNIVLICVPFTFFNRFVSNVWRGSGAI